MKPGMNILPRIAILLLWLTAPHLAEGWQVTLIDSFPRPGRNVPGFEKAAAIDIDFAGNLYIIDRGRHRLLKYTAAGDFVKEIGGFGNAAEQFDDPRDVFAHTTLDVFIADFNNNRVVRYDKNLNFLNNLNSQYPEPYQFDRVLSVAVSSQYDLFLLEDGEKKIIKFSRFSQPTETFGGIHETFGQLLDPVQMAIQDSKHVFVSDPAQHGVVVFDYLGNYITILQHPKMIQPTGLHWGEDRRLYVADPSANAIFVFSENLKFQSVLTLPSPAKGVVDVALWFHKEDGTRRLYALSNTRCWILKLHRSQSQ